MNWEDIYVKVATEVDVGKMPERIVAARQAVEERLGAFEHGDHTERDRLDHALKALTVLETESRNWSSR